MARKYDIDIFDIKEIESFQKELSNLEELLQSKKFMRFIGNKCLKELKKIIRKSAGGNEYIPQMQEYKSSNKIEVEKDSVRIYNDSMVDMSNVSEKTLQNYPEGLSLAKLIEFGTGIRGTSDEEYEWLTEYNPNRDYTNGWFYEKDGQLYWTKGQQGYFIYQQLSDVVKEHIHNWVWEFVENNMGR